MRMINRLVQPTSGRITIGGEDALKLDVDTLRRRIGYAIQQAGLFPHFTVAQNIAVVPGLLGWDKKKVNDRVEEMMDLVGLDPADFRDRFPRQLSGGQQQRVGVARALAADPPVLLMDEPFGAVDPITRSTLQDELLRLQSELRKTIVFVTHDFGEAVKLGDRIAVLGQRSKVLQYDTPQAILASPADDTVAGFVGSGASLRQLSLVRVKDVELRAHPSVHRNDSLESVRNVLANSDYDWVVVVDERDRPVNWVRERNLRHAQTLADAFEPLDVLSTQSTLEDALEAILAEQHASAVVSGPGSKYAGVVTLDTLIDTITRLRTEAESPDGDGS
jgi:osmoprotectant transport system ATP-binding protein